VGEYVSRASRRLAGQLSLRWRKATGGGFTAGEYVSRVGRWLADQLSLLRHKAAGGDA